MQEQDINQELQLEQEKIVLTICNLLKESEISIQDNLSLFVAAQCDIDHTEMMNDTSKYYAAQCRWLYWYAYRYMTNEPYTKMAKRLGKTGRMFSSSGIQSGVNKMAQMVTQDTVWRKRWILIKHLIKTSNENAVSTISQFKPQSSVKVVVAHPKDVEVNVEFKQE